MHWASISLLAALLGSTTAQVNGISPPSYPSPWGHGGRGWKDAYEKARAFVSQLTLLEKVNITTGTGWTQDLCVGNTGSIPRLGFRGFCMQDSPLGVRLTDLNTAFPAGINVAATWDKKLFYLRGKAMGQEHQGKGIDVQLGPVAGPLGRIPEGGRGWEGFSPDPVLTGIAMAHTIRGIQDAGVIACAKHYIYNEQEHYRQQMSSNVDDKTLHELYLWPFADAVRIGEVGSIMCSYNRANDSYACENSYLLNHVLKGELDFQGFVMSDWGAQHSGVGSALAGLEMTMPGEQVFGVGTYSFWGGNLTAAVLNGTIPQWRIDDMAVRIMAAYYKVGRDKTRIPINFSSWTLNTTGFLHQLGMADFTQINYHVNVQDDHARLVRTIGARSTVLLKNGKNALPLKRPGTIAVIGEDAHANPAGPNACPDRGCDVGTLAMGWGSGTANFPYIVAPVDALRVRANSDRSTFTNFSNNYDLTGAAAAAKGADVAIVFVNADSGEEYITVDDNEGDRNNLTLWGNGDALIAAVAANNKNTVVVMHTVGAVLVETIKNNPNVTALLWAGIPGQESGNSITDVLYGTQNPSAKTPFTWGAARSDWGVDILYNSTLDVPEQDFTEGVFIDHRHFDAASISPTYEFGFGLSYTTFSYSSLNIIKHHARPYMPTTGKTPAAKTYGTIDYNLQDNAYPPAFPSVSAYVYPYLDNTTGRPEGSNGDAPPGSQDGSPQPKLPAGGAPGGNDGLYDILYTVTAEIKNTGAVPGIEVAQLYISLGAPTDPKIVLRGFAALEIQPGAVATFRYDVTRRDVSNWDVGCQNWVVSEYPKMVYVGASSRDLPLCGGLV